MTVHFIDNDFILREYTLDTNEVTKSHNYETTAKEINK